MKVLHIAGWYPNRLKPYETPFIERHIRALDSVCENTIWQLDVRLGARWSICRESLKADRTLIITTPIRRWYVIEWLATLVILWAWFTRDRTVKHDAVNFHIAYPNCTRIGLLRRVMRLPLVITEHWSIYRLGFKSGAQGLDRIRRIFHQGIPVIAVSKALTDDILGFAGPPSPPVHIVPNVVDTGLFRPRDGQRTEGRFFAIATWRYPKRPLVLIEAIGLLRARGRDARLRIAGEGDEVETMRAAIEAAGLTSSVELIGQASPQHAASLMQEAHALLHASDYETFSAVCAEALCCGTPVAASAVGGIREYLTPAMGVLVEENTAVAWADAIDLHWDRLLRMDGRPISELMGELVSEPHVAARYEHVLEQIIRLSPTA